MTDEYTDSALPVHLYFLLDRTGSMRPISDDVIGGFNTFLAEQQAKPGKCRMTLVQFDSQAPFEILANAKDISEIPQLTEETFTPRSMTPLIDAECMLIELAEKRVETRAKKNKKAEAIMFVTFTDGMENASERYALDRLQELKAAHADEWVFLYLGVGHDAYTQARDFGTYTINTVSEGRDGEGVEVAYASASTEANNVRERATRGLRTNSSQTAAAQKANLNSNE